MEEYKINQIVVYNNRLWHIKEIEDQDDGNIILTLGRGPYKMVVNAKEVKKWK